MKNLHSHKLCPAKDGLCPVRLLRIVGMNPLRFWKKALSMVPTGLATFAALAVCAESTNSTAVLQIKADQVTAHVSPILYGLMTEEINYAYDGGLYAELIRNRTFKESVTNVYIPHWTVVQTGNSNAAISLDTNQPVNDALTISLKLEIAKASRNQPAGIANDGFWGIPLKPQTTYHASFYAKAAKGFSGPVTVALVGNANGTIFASAKVRHLTDTWQKYEVTLTTDKVPASKDNHFAITAENSGTVWFSFVSLFPPTYKNRANGNRDDIMQLLADMKPSFLRFPGGNYLEGDTIETRFNWKNTLGDISKRPGHNNDAWHYWSSDGMGLLDFMHWCEDLNMQPVLAVYAGYSLRQQHINPGTDLEPYVQDALDEIEYLTGGTSTTWGARRAQDGHPVPFKLQYVEIGNEDQFDRSGTYGARFAQFYDAIKAKNPQLQLIATTRVTNREPDVVDEHYYRAAPHDMESHGNDYDSRPRKGPKVFVGEWATRIGSPTPNISGALGDAAWMVGMERNSDLVIMSCYAPLFVNVSDLTNADRVARSMQWPTDLIGYDALSSYGSPGYYAQKMFNLNHGDDVLAVTSSNVPMMDWQPPARRRNGVEQPAPPLQHIPTLFFNATRDSKTGIIFMKVVNTAAAPQTVQFEISGTSSIMTKGAGVLMRADKPDDTNSINDPTKVVPTPIELDGLGENFAREFPPYSITVFRVMAK